MKKSSTTTIVVVIIILVLIGAYFYMKGDGSSVEGSLLVQSGTSQSIGNQELVLLRQVGSISIDSKFFSDPVFKSLSDISQIVPTVGMYRPDPFAPVPGVARPLSSSSVTPIKVR